MSDSTKAKLAENKAETEAGPPAKRARTWSTSELFGSEVEVPEAAVELCASRTASELHSPSPCGRDEVQKPAKPAMPAPSPERAQPQADDKFLIREGSHPGEFFACGDKFHSAYTVGNKIGEGGFGKVFIAIHKVTVNDLTNHPVLIS